MKLSGSEPVSTPSRPGASRPPTTGLWDRPPRAAQPPPSVAAAAASRAADGGPG